MLISIKYFEEECISRFEKLEDEFIYQRIMGGFYPIKSEGKFTPSLRMIIFD